MYKIANKEILIAASVSCMDMLNFKESMQEAEEAGIDFYHFDIVDGRFNTCFILGQTLLEAMRPHTKLPIEVHLAVDEPEKFSVDYAKMGADYVGVHYEALGDDYEELFAKIEEAGAMPTLQLRAETGFEQKMKEMFPKIGWINKLTVNPGYSGQKMQPQALEHIRQIKKEIDACGIDLKIQADGNIKEQTIPMVIKAGARILTGGTSGLFVREKTVKQNVSDMTKIAKENL